MKSSNFKHIFLSFVAVAMLTSCSESDGILDEVDNGGNVTFNLTADGLVQSRAAADDFRIVMAIYDETETNVVVAETEYTSSTFSVRLDPGKYVCLFWADRGSDNYDATNLNEVKLSDSATNAEAFYAKQGITVTDGTTVNVTLHRAVAQVVLRETATLLKGDLTIGYTGYHSFNVSTGIASNETAVTNTISVPATITGSVESPADVCSIFLLANSEENELTDFSVKYEDDEAKTISNVPIQANRTTNLNGEFGGTPYVTFSAEREQTFTMNFCPSDISFTLGAGEYFEYSVGGGEWTRFTTTVSDVPFGGALGNLRLRGKSSQGTTNSSGVVDVSALISFGASDVLVESSGDIRTLVDYKNYRTVSMEQARFRRLFERCTALVTAPELPATELASICYSSMFSGCTSLTKAPALPATTLSEYCYNSMFFGCTSLITAPVLPATELADNCYNNMFGGCTALTTAPKLPATTLENRCYQSMFQDCTALTKAPELPAEELKPCCYQEMFSGCTKLSEVTMLATNIGDFDALKDWLNNAGTQASSRTLTLANSQAYTDVESYLPDIWKQGAEGTTVNFKN